MIFLKKEGIGSSSCSFIISSSKLSLLLAKDRWLLAQHFFQVPAVVLDRWMYPQPWTHSSSYVPQGWWNTCSPFTNLVAISTCLFALAIRSCLASYSRTPDCSRLARRQDVSTTCSASLLPGSLQAFACCIASCSSTPGCSCLAQRWDVPTTCSASLLPGSSHAIWSCLASCSCTPGWSCLAQCRDVSTTCSASLLPGSSRAVARCIASCSCTPGCSRLARRRDVSTTCSASLLAGSWHLFLWLAAFCMRLNALGSPWWFISLWFMVG